MRVDEGVEEGAGVTVFVTVPVKEGVRARVGEKVEERLPTATVRVGVLGMAGLVGETDMGRVQE